MGLHFINGVIIIVSKISILLISTILFTSCFQGSRIHAEKDRREEVGLFLYNWPSHQSSGLKLYIQVQNDLFVFTKSKDHFSASVEFNLSISKLDDETQIFQNTWSEEISSKYYEDTRGTENRYTSERMVNLSPGEYRISVMVLDKDSRNKWKISENITITNFNSWGDIIPAFKSDSMLFFAGGGVVSEIDTLYCISWIPDSMMTEGTELHYSISTKSEDLAEGELEIIHQGENEPDLFNIPISNELSGMLTFTFDLGGTYREMEVYLASGMTKYFTDINQAVEILGAILPYGEYKKLKKMNKLEKREYFQDYWEKNDPTPDTEYNELREEFYSRVEFVQKKFSILGPGWRSDRGHIYLIYGKPARIEETINDNYGYRFQIWHYPSGKQFVFIDDGMFGNYRLYREIP